MSTLDQNIVTTIWGVVALFGILVSLMVPLAEQEYKEFQHKGTSETYESAKRWIRYTRMIPFVIALGLIPVTLFAILPNDHVQIGWPPGKNLLLVLSGIPALVAFGFVVLTITRSVPSFNLDPLPVPEDRYKSLGSGVATTLAFVNAAQRPLRACWLTWTGERSTEEHLFTLPPGKEIVVQTYCDHYWLIMEDQDDAPGLVVFCAAETPRRAIVEPGILTGRQRPLVESGLSQAQSGPPHTTTRPPETSAPPDRDVAGEPRGSTAPLSVRRTGEGTYREQA